MSEKIESENKPKKDLFKLSIEELNYFDAN